MDLDTGVMVKKHGCGCPRRSKNKPKESAMAGSSSSAPVKRCPGRPLGSKNKPKLSASLATKPLDVAVVRHNAPLPSSGNIYFFIAFAGAQCREQQSVPLKFTEFMDGQELREAIL
jgi:hypothetical protein